MSWSATGKITTQENGPIEVEYSHYQPQTGHGADESIAAIGAAQDGAQKLIETGAFGRGAFRVFLSGHSNPGNKPSGQWSNDHAQITITQEPKA